MEMCIVSLFGRLAQLARAPALQAGGHWFKSSIAHDIKARFFNRKRAFFMS